jgi:hypothetical protein
MPADRTKRLNEMAKLPTLKIRLYMELSLTIFSSSETGDSPSRA